MLSNRILRRKRFFDKVGTTAIILMILMPACLLPFNLLYTAIAYCVFLVIGLIAACLD